MQPGKNIKIFINYFLGPLLFVWLSFSIYRQIRHQPFLEESWLTIRDSLQSSKIIYLLGAILLVPVNWGLEAVKWKLSVKNIYPVGWLLAFKAVLSGVSISVTMPNRIGEYLGRMMYIPEGSRLKTISVTLVCSLAQVLVTMFAGIIGLLVLHREWLKAFPELMFWSQFIIYGSVILSVLMALVYFNVSSAVNLTRKWIKGDRYLYLVEALGGFSFPLLFQLLLLSFIRYLVFVMQYLLLFYLFGVYVSPGIILLVMTVVFLFMTIIPSIALIEVWLRGEILIMLMGVFSTNALGISFTSVTIWFINLILPAVVGSLLILNLRIFRKRNGL